MTHDTRQTDIIKRKKAKKIAFMQIFLMFCFVTRAVFCYIIILFSLFFLDFKQKIVLSSNMLGQTS